jgi:ABC-type multidrug transport system fused ATPase/permease subunit
MGHPIVNQQKRGLARQLVGLLNRRERHQAMLLLLAMVVQAAAEIVGVASVAPFMGVVADVSLIHRNWLLSRLYEWGGFATESGFLIALGFAVVAALVLCNGVSALAYWATLRFVWATHDRLATGLLRGYLAQPYGFFVQRNASSLNKNILAEVHTAIEKVLLPALNAIARSLVTIAIIGLLVMLDPALALTLVLVLGGAYGTVYLAVRRKQARLGRIRADANEERFKITSEAFGGIKEVKVLQRESAFVARFGLPSQRFSQATASNKAIAVLPRYVLDTIAMGSVLLIVIYYLRVGHGVEQILPTLSLYAFAGLRLMPALQEVFGAFAEIRFHRAVIDDLTVDLNRFGHDEAHDAPAPARPLQSAICFDDVHFRYPGAADRALRGVSLSIPCNQTIGLVGASGSGKTTLVDLLLGLYAPTQGSIRIDDLELDETTVRNWRQRVGYVPQHIFLCDDSIANNIAFGMPAHEVDTERVVQVARIAHLHEFIQTLPAGYDTVVGERGVRLSGGQRQRIGIARALYHDPSVLVMDEATSALDGATEDAVMEAIYALAGQKTIVLIAHRLGTVKECDRIYLLAGGRVAEQGSHDELAAGSAAFRALAKLA